MKNILCIIYNNKGVIVCTSETVTLFYTKEYEYDILRNYSISPFIEENAKIKEVLIQDKLSWNTAENEDIGTGNFDIDCKSFDAYFNETGDEKK